MPRPENVDGINNVINSINNSIINVDSIFPSAGEPAEG